MDEGLIYVARACDIDSLINVARAGEIDGLYTILGQNRFVLDEIDKIPFVETPLHIAVLAGETEFAVEIANLKPTFATKLNPDGYSPLHLASQNGNLEMVKELLRVIGDELCLIKGRGMKTPLHCAATSAESNVEVAIELFCACPEAISELTVRHETVFHLAVKSGNFDVLKVLAKNLQWKKEKEILNWKDNEGNTALHIAVSTRQRKVVELLLSIRWLGGIIPIVKVNTLNKNNHTALDVLGDSAGDVEIENMLHRAGAIRSSNAIPSSPSWFAAFFKNILIWFPQPSLPLRRSKSYFGFKIGKHSLNKARDAMLVVVVLIAAATFQTGTNPPGGFWQDDSPTPNNTTTATTTSKTSTDRYINKPAIQTFIPENTKQNSTHMAGTAILSNVPEFYTLFSDFNLIGFGLSLFMIYILTEDLPLPLRSVLGLNLLLMWGTYIVSLLLWLPLLFLICSVFLSAVGILLAVIYHT